MHIKNGKTTWCKVMFKRSDFKYEIEWGCCDGRKNRYISYTLDGIRKKIDNDKQLSNDEKNILKYGYEREFIKDIRTYNFCIDNGFDIHWYKYKLVY